MFLQNVENRIKLILILIILPLYSIAQQTDNIQLANEYYINGEFQKAADIYFTLAKQQKNIPDIHNNYFNVLLSLNDFKTADKYIKKALKSFPQNIYYKIDQGLLYQAMADNENAEKTYLQIIDDIKQNDFLIRTAAQYFISKQLTQFALESYLIGRKNSKDKSRYALEIANAYRILGDKVKMIDEYLTFASLRKSNLRYVKNIMQNLLQEQSDIENFQNVLIENIQDHPNETIYGDLLIWVNLQQKQFYNAFVQARALDKRFKEGGKRIMEIGNIAIENKAFDDAITMYDYILTTYPEGQYYITARRQIITAREKKIKNDFPVDIAAIRQLTNDYKKLFEDIGVSSITIEAYRSKALLHAFYLNENDSAIQILNEIIQMPRVNRKVQSRSKLDLGDIYILIGEPWESTLLYSQVEKSNKSSKIGYEAKLKNAQLNYYKGNFELAKSHLDILKLATTREIANDAISLGLLIQDNTVLDSSDFVMKEYAGIELILFQNKRDSAKQAFTEMLKKYPGHSLTDEIHWKLANIYMEQGDFENALLQLQVIQSNYSTDIMGDDAMFLIARIYEEYLFDSVKAMDVYQKFLSTYPGSIYVSEARKKFRRLRGDSIN